MKLNKYPPSFFLVLHLPTSYYHSIPAAPELGQSRKVDISRLRDIRKRLDTGHITVKELEVIAVECVDELVELCSGKVYFGKKSEALFIYFLLTFFLHRLHWKHGDPKTIRTMLRNDEIHHA